MEWVYVILLLGGIFGAAYAWETVKEKMVAKGGRAGKVMEGMEVAGEVVGGGLHSLLQKGLGLIVGALGVAGCWFLMNKGFDFGILILVMICFAYALYLIWPGRRSFFIFF